MMGSGFEILDFHTHPFLEPAQNICAHTEYCDMSCDNTLKYMKELGISRICGSVLETAGSFPEDFTVWDRLAHSNRVALELAERYGDFYIPGFHVHPDFVRESCDEIESMSKKGVRLIGELVPYRDRWSDYSCKEFDEILDVAQMYHMIVNFHTMDNQQIDEMVKKHPKVVFVAAHPGEKENALRHFERMKMSENYYLDLSGTGLFRHGMLRHGIDEAGADRFLFGSDFPICSPAVNIGGILLDTLYTDEEKEKIFSGNAKRLLGIV